MISTRSRHRRSLRSGAACAAPDTESWWSTHCTCACERVDRHRRAGALDGRTRGQRRQDFLERRASGRAAPRSIEGLRQNARPQVGRAPAPQALSAQQHPRQHAEHRAGCGDRDCYRRGGGGSGRTQTPRRSGRASAPSRPPADRRRQRPPDAGARSRARPSSARIRCRTRHANARRGRPARRRAGSADRRYGHAWLVSLRTARAVRATVRAREPAGTWTGWACRRAARRSPRAYSPRRRAARRRAARSRPADRARARDRGRAAAPSGANRLGFAERDSATDVRDQPQTSTPGRTQLHETPGHRDAAYPPRERAAAVVLVELGQHVDEHVLREILGRGESPEQAARERGHAGAKPR